MTSEPFVIIEVTQNGVAEVSLGARSALEEIGSLELYGKIRDNIRAIDGRIKESVKPKVEQCNATAVGE